MAHDRDVAGIRCMAVLAALSDYLSCCRLQRRSLDDLAGVLDEASGTRVFSTELDIMRREPGCPERMVPGP